MGRLRENRFGRGCRAVAAVLVVAASMVVGGVAPADAATRLEVAAGVDGQFRPSGSLPVAVEITADRALAGRLDVLVTGTAAADVAGRAVLEIEVPGGSVKEYRVVLPAPATPEGQVRVTFRPDGAAPVTETVELDFASANELVGLLPGVAPTGEPGSAANLPVTGGQALPVVLAPDDWDPAVLHGVGTLGATAADLAALTQPWRSELGSWLTHGGRLLVDEAPGTSLAGIPERWVAGPSTDVGLGEVVFTGDSVVNADLASVVVPTPVFSANEAWAILQPQGTLTDLSRDLASAAGLTVLPVMAIVVALCVYGVVVSPLTFTVLARLRRRELAWVVVPLLAVISASGIYVVGTVTRTDTATTHLTSIETTAAGAVSTSNVGAPGRGEIDGEFPAGWSIIRQAPSFDGLGQANNTTVGIDGEARTATTSLTGSGFGIVGGQGPSDLAGGLTVEITSGEDGGLAGTVTNGTEHDLTDVIAFTGMAFTQIDDLPAGATVEWEVDGSVAWERGSMPGSDLGIWANWDDMEGGFMGPMPMPMPVDGDYGGRFVGGPVGMPLGGQTDEQGDGKVGPSASVWAQDRMTHLAMVGTNAVVGVAGWTHDLESPVTVGGSDADGATVITGYSDGNAARAQLPFRVVRTAMDMPQPAMPAGFEDRGGGLWSNEVGAVVLDQETGFGPSELLIEFRLPADLDPSVRDRLAVSAMQNVASVWTGERWERLAVESAPWDDVEQGEAGRFNGGDAAQIARIPPPAAAGGRVLVRIPIESWSLPQLSLLVMAP